jgi:hypothetical protein
MCLVVKCTQPPPYMHVTVSRCHVKCEEEEQPRFHALSMMQQFRHDHLECSQKVCTQQEKMMQDGGRCGQ